MQVFHPLVAPCVQHVETTERKIALDALSTSVLAEIEVVLGPAFLHVR